MSSINETKRTVSSRRRVYATASGPGVGESVPGAGYRTVPGTVPGAVPVTDPGAVSGSHSGVAPMLPTLPIGDMAATLWQRRWLIIGVVLATSLIALALLSSLTPRYRAQSVIALDRASNYSATFDTPLTSLVVDGETVASEIELIYSRELIGQVVVGQKLLATEEYSADDTGLVASLKAQLKAAIRNLVPGRESPSPEADPVASAIDQFQDNLDIQRKGISRAIVISFDAEDPTQAAAVANALASRYIDDQQRLQREQEGVATDQLEAKMADVRQQLRSTEQAIEEQRRALGQVTPDGASKIEQRLAGLNTRLINADAEVAAAQAELQQARALRDTPSAIDSIPATLASAAVGQLREREFDLQARLSELSTKYGEKHPLVQQVSNQLRQTRDNLGLEIDKTIGSLQSKATIAASRQRSIEREMARLETQESTANPAKAALVGLQREAGSLRDRIAFLERRINEVSQVNSLANLRPFARIISPAQVPTSAAFPNKTILLPLIALLAGLATVAVLLGKYLYRHQLRTRLPLLPGNAAWVAAFPRQGGGRRAGANRRSKSIDALADTALTNVHKALPASTPGTVMVTSMLEASHDHDGEPLALSLARASARRGRRTLHVDLKPLDARSARSANGSSTAARASANAAETSGGKRTDAHAGLWPAGTPEYKLGPEHDAVAALKGLSPVSQAVENHPTLPLLDTMAAEGTVADAAMLLSGERLQQCLDDWGSTYDTIIIDAPPVLSSPHAALINQACSLGLLTSPLALLMSNPADLQQALQRLHKRDHGLTGIIVDDLDEALFDRERFAYERSEHYLARLTGNRLPGPAAGLVDQDAQVRGAGRSAAEAVGHDTYTGPNHPMSGVAHHGPRTTGRQSTSADRLSNVVSLRRNRQRQSSGENPPPVHDEAWVLRQAPERFTIRLTTPRKPHEVGKSLTYLAEYLPLAWYNQGTRQNTTPVMIVGLFNSADEVREVLDSAAMATIADRAEPCMIAEIQAEIIRHRQAESEQVDDATADRAPDGAIVG